MPERLIRAASRNALLAAGMSAVMIYRWEREGWPRNRVALLVFLSVALALTFLVATAWQARSRVDRWSWTTTLGAFFLTLAGVCVAFLTAIKAAVALR
ncbi:MAG TPA: hypothetical protein VGH33_04575 [Isosphaeraceae bacterium]